MNRVGRCPELWLLNGSLVDRSVPVMIIISDESLCENQAIKVHQWFRQKQINKSFTLCLLCTVLGHHLPKWLANEKACLIFRQIGLSGPPGILSIISQWLHLDVAYKILMMSWHVLMLVASWHNERYFSPRFWSLFTEFGICMRRPFFYWNLFIVLVWIPYF